MADFKTKVIILAGMASMFASMAFGQAALAGTGIVTTGAVFVRAEGATELLPTTTMTINNPSGSATTVTFTVYLAPSLTITSQVISKVSEATATGSGAPVAGTVTGSTVTFTNVAINASPASTTISIAGIRVNASSLATGSGIPQGVSEQAFLQGSTGVVTPGATAATIVAYATNGLANTGTYAVTSNPGNPVALAVSTTGIAITNVTICGGAAINNPAAGSFGINMSEGFVGAFKTLAGEAGVDAATSGTRVSITFGGVPANVSVYLPLVINANNGGQFKLVISPTAATSASNLVADAAVKNEPVAVGAVAVANGTATGYYETYASSAASIDTYTVPVYLVNTGGTLAAPAPAMTATVSLAPSIAAGATPTNYPSFVGANSQQTVSGSSFTACSTTMLFPFVTNQAGFESGIAIANTSTDLLGTKSGAPFTSVTPQAGTCTLTFFGGTTNPVAYTSPSVAAGTTWTATLTSVTGGTPNTFGGYMIAQCNFLFGHGFLYISYNIGQSSGMAMGYLAEEVPGARAASTAAPEALNN